MKNKPVPKQRPLEILLSPVDNARLANLCGPLDENIRQIKTYVNLGLGVGIIASMAFNSEADQQLKLIPVPDLFPANVTRLAVRKGAHLRAYAYALIEKICPELEEEVVRQATNSLKPTSQ